MLMQWCPWCWEQEEESSAFSHISLSNEPQRAGESNLLHRIHQIVQLLTKIINSMNLKSQKHAHACVGFACRELIQQRRHFQSCGL